jgi:hypothetical protein
MLSPPSFASTPVIWTAGQLARLRGEWRTALRSFAYHPFVALSASRGEPPTFYRVDFRVRSLTLDASEQLQYVDSVPMEIWITPGYPSTPPLVRPLAVLFHPNISYEAVHFTSAWQPNQTLLDVIHQVGEFLAWRSYDPDAVANDVALQWLHDNAAMLPLDGQADFTPSAGGEPLDRITRYGPTTLDQMGSAIDELSAALAGDAAGPNIEQARSFSRQTHAAMRIFLEPDVPATLRQRAAEFDRLALDLPGSVPSWEHVRGLRSWAKTILVEVGELKTAAEQLPAEVTRLSSLVGADFDTAAGAIGHLPSSEVLSPLLLRLPPLFKETETRAQTLRSQLALPQSGRPPNPLKPESAINRQLAIKLKEAEEDVEFAHHAAGEALAAADPVLPNARAETLALRVIGRWREYLDLFAAAGALEQHLSQWNGDAIEGYFIHSPDGQFGPFQFEQEVALGDARVYLTRGKGAALEIRSAVDDSTLGRGANGAARAMVAQGAGPAVSMTFTVPHEIDQPLLQLDYAIGQTSTLLPKLHAIGISDAHSWCGRIQRFLSGGEAQQEARAEQRRAAHRWETLAEELRQLAAFKARLSTYFLVTRCAATVSALVSERSAHNATIAQATKRVAAIAAKSSRDEAGQLVVPGRLAKSYTEETAAMEAAQKSLRRLEPRIKGISHTLRERLASPRQCGRPEIPVLRHLHPVSQELAELAPFASDDHLQAAVADLASTLQTSLMLNLPPAPPLTAEPPAAPASAEITRGAGEAPIVSEVEDAPAAQEIAPAEHVVEAAVDDAPPEAGITEEPLAEESTAASEAVAEAGEPAQESASVDAPDLANFTEAAQSFVAHEDEEKPPEEEDDWIEL